MRLGPLVAAAALACRAAPIPEPARYPAGTPYQPRFVEVHGTRLRYLDEGRGRPVVLLHGIAASIYSWRAVIPALVEAGFRVIALDHRGFGSSEKPADGYANADYVALTLAFLDSLGLEQVVLVGHSMGGQIAAEVALTAPGRVTGVALLGSSGAGVRVPAALRVVRWPVVGSLAAALRGRWITGRLLRSTYADPARVTPADVDQYYAPVAEPGFARALRGVLRHYRFDGLLPRLDSLSVPVLAVWGERDRWIPVGVGRRLAARLPRVAFFTVPDAGHNVQEEAPERTNRLLVTFLSEGLPRIPENLAWSTSCSSSPPLSSPSIRSTPARSAS